LACPSKPEPGADVDVNPSTGETAQELPEGVVCLPGTVKECQPELSKEGLICDASGAGWIKGICHGTKRPENESICKEAACTECIPGIQICDGDDFVLRCKEDGSDWETYSECLNETVCIQGQCQKLCDVNFKANSYIGCDYWAVDLDNAFVPGGSRGFFDAMNAQFAVAIANPPTAARSAIVEVRYKEGAEVLSVPFDSAGVPLPKDPLAPGELRVYRLPARNVNGTVQAPLAYQFSSSAPVIAYQFNPLENELVYSNDASLLLPATLLGKEYLVMTREQTFEQLRGYLTVVAVQPGQTQVSVDVTAPTLAGEVHPGAPDQKAILAMEPGDTAFFVLEQFDVLNIETNAPGADLTGSQVLADKRVAVFGGSEAANAPNTARCIDIDPLDGWGLCEYDGKTKCKTLLDCVDAGFNTCCADHLEQQMFPLTVWGTHYVGAKSFDRGMEADIYRIMAAEKNTKVTLVPPLPGISVPVLNRGEWFEFETRQHFEVLSSDDKPILVGQFLAAEDAPEPNIAGDQSGDAGTGDPAFMLLIPVEQFRYDYVILVPEEYAHNFINVVAPIGANVVVDGEEVPDAYFEGIPTSTYQVYRKRLADPGAHTIGATQPIGVMVYGYDQYVSYGYTGGLDLKELNKPKRL
jgi:hypothetical protein